MIWIAFPGLGLPPSDLDGVRQALPSSVQLRVLDQWRTPLSSDPARLWQELGRSRGGIGLLGHSVGGLTALRWLLERPAGVAALVLLDPSPPESRVPRWTQSAIVDAAATRLLAQVAPLARAVPRCGHDLGGFVSDLSIGRRRTEMIRRYSSPGGAESIWQGLRASWALANHVEEVLGSLDRRGLEAVFGGLERSPQQLVGLRGSHTGFLRGQRDLSRRIGSRIVAEPASGHHLTSAVPQRIAAMMMEATPSRWAR